MGRGLVGGVILLGSCLVGAEGRGTGREGAISAGIRRRTPKKARR